MSQAIRTAAKAVCEQLAVVAGVASFGLETGYAGPRPEACSCIEDRSERFLGGSVRFRRPHMECNP